MIDVSSGEIKTVKQIDFETLRSHVYTLKVIAFDNGLPQLSSRVFVHVTILDKNENASVFDMRSYNVSINENVPIGFLVLQVNANDSDTGRNGEVFYSLVSNSVDGLFMINGSSGEIKTVKEIDLETLPSDVYTLKVIALDNGLPQLSSSVYVYVTILDKNDNCPIFNPLPSNNFNVSVDASPGTVITSTSARDEDSGSNGVVKYSIPHNNKVGGEFAVDENTGKLTTNGKLGIRGYDVTIVARDQGVPPCSRSIDLSVKVVARHIEIPTTQGNSQADLSIS